MNDINRAYRNRDYLKRLNYPRQTYAFSGIDFGDADIPQRVRSKLNINGAPMIITPLPPGANGSNAIAWRDTYGASMDCIMSIMDGDQLNDNILSANSEFVTPYREAIPHAENTNLYDPVDGKQQIQFIAGRPDVDTMRAEAAQPMEVFESRGLGMRAPMQMCGWGKTITMRPTDPEPEDPRENDNEHKFDRSTWEIGPADFRWDSRRKVWRAWNDLIADDFNQNLGTFVFSTNPDATCGFPWLRGKLEDVWSVRHTTDDAGKFTAAQKDDITKTGKLVTKLDSLALGGSILGPWSDVLVTHNKCADVAAATCGGEQTALGQMAIGGGADFLVGDLVGPIRFNSTPLGQNVNFIRGEMYFEGDGCDGEWIPAFQFPPPCNYARDEFAVTWENDQVLQDAIHELCLDTNDALEELFDLIILGPGGGIPGPGGVTSALCVDVAGDQILADAVLVLTQNVANAWVDLEAWTLQLIRQITAEMQASVSSAIVGAASSLESAINALQDQIYSDLDTLQAHFAAQIALCVEGCNITPIQFDKTRIIITPPMGQPPEVEPEWDGTPFVLINRNTIEPAIQDAKVLYDAVAEACNTPPQPGDPGDEPPQVTSFSEINDPCSSDVVERECPNP